jgi:hypothetical protein
MQRSKNHFSRSALFDAYHTLFGKHDARADIQTFQPGDLKAAYRDAVRATHPDVNHGVNSDLLTAKFRKVIAAYDLLNDYLAARETTRVSHERFSAPASREPAAASWSWRSAQQKSSRPRPAYEPLRQKDPSHHFYDGLMPTIGLKIGLFLYYSKKISFEHLTEALVWQRTMRPPIGELAVQWKWLHEHFVSVVLSNVETCGQFGERAVKMGLLKEAQVKMLLRQQAIMQKPLGHYFVKNRILAPQVIKESLAVMTVHNKVFHDERSLREQLLLKYKK